MPLSLPIGHSLPAGYVPGVAHRRSLPLQKHQERLEDVARVAVFERSLRTSYSTAIKQLGVLLYLQKV